MGGKGRKKKQTEGYAGGRKNGKTKVSRLVGKPSQGLGGKIWGGNLKPRKMALGAAKKTKTDCGEMGFNHYRQRYGERRKIEKRQSKVRRGIGTGG